MNEEQQGSRTETVDLADAIPNLQERQIVKGTVVRVDPAFRLPDVSAHGGGAPRQPTYGVRFTARELWGDTGGENESVCVDLWASYLERP